MSNTAARGRALEHQPGHARGNEVCRLPHHQCRAHRYRCSPSERSVWPAQAQDHFLGACTPARLRASATPVMAALRAALGPTHADEPRVT